MTEETMPGPVDFVLIEFPADATTAPVAEAMSDLVEAGVVRLYDIAVIRKSVDGRSRRVDLATAAAGSGFEIFAGAQSGLFDEDDIQLAGNALDPDTKALLIAFENAWAASFVTAAYGAGGQVVASDRIPAQTLIEALDMADVAS